MPDPARTSPPIVLVSSAMAIGSRFYRPVVEEFERNGWQARALPRRGFEPGSPTASREDDWSYADEIAELADTVAAARTEDPQRPVLALGHSLGAQLIVGYEQDHEPLDGIITVAGSVPYFRHFAYGGVHLAAMASLVPVISTTFGYVPKPAFGGPGARTLMREWGRMIRTGEPPFPIAHRVSTPAFLVSLEGDGLAPARSVDAFAENLFEPATVTRWHCTRADVGEGASLDHIGWVRTSGAIVDHVVRWWTDRG